MLTCKCNPNNINNASTVNNNHYTTQNINSFNTTNNITNNNYINVIQFEFDKKKHTQFISSHISIDEIKELIDKYFDLRDKYNHLDILNIYYDKLFHIPENKCIKKTNLRSPYSQVHKGQNKWSTMLDRNIYDKLVIDTTKNFVNKLNETDNAINTSFQNKIDKIRGHSDNLIYHIFDDEKDLLRERQIAKDNLKCNIFNYTSE